MGCERDIVSQAGMPMQESVDQLIVPRNNAGIYDDAVSKRRCHCHCCCHN